jgi:hypothetical protein
MIAVSAEAHSSTPSTRAPHARVPTLTPTPDGPATQDDRPYGLELLDCVWSADCVVSASFHADEVAELLLFCVAELEPPFTLPPATDTGMFALTPF